MSIEAIVATAGVASLGVTALIIAYLIVREGRKPWQAYASETARRVKAEADRDLYKAEAEKWATLNVEKDAKIRDDDKTIADLRARLKPRPGHGTDSLRDVLEAETAEAARDADGTDSGGDPGDDVPRVATPGSFPVDPHLRG